MMNNTKELSINAEAMQIVQAEELVIMQYLETFA
jgi:hypothetical protein